MPPYFGDPKRDPKMENDPSAVLWGVLWGLRVGALGSGSGVAGDPIGQG